MAVLGFVNIASASLLFSSTFANPLPIAQFDNLPSQDNNKADSSIGTSGDVWAMLVANIVPLLILLGEKHVKAYFKIMRNRSHYLIYAVGPIGLVTAVVTLIRILPPKFRPLKRLIGRQYERRAEVLSDVTSVSCGAVGTEFKNGAFEQTIEPDEEDLAICYLHGRVEARPTELIKAIGDYWTESSQVYYRFLSERSEIPIQAGQFILAYSFKSNNIDTARKIALRAFQSPCADYTDELPDELREEAEANHISGLMSTYTALTGVSMGLTAVGFSDTRRNTILRYVISTACVVVNAILIWRNWISQKDVQNTTFISVGLFISIIGAYYTAYIVDSQSKERDFTMKNVIRAGFYSQVSKDWGRQLKEIPKRFIVSCDAEFAKRAATRAIIRGIRDMGRRSSHEIAEIVEKWKLEADQLECSTWDWVSIGVALFMTLGYVALYVGLRTANYWCALSVLGSSAVASLARTWLVPDTMELERDELDHKRLNAAFPFSYQADSHYLRDSTDTFFLLDQETRGRTVGNILPPGNLDVATSQRPDMIHQNLYSNFDKRITSPVDIFTTHYEVIAAQKGTPIAFDSNLECLTKNVKLYRENEHLLSALRLTIALRKASIVPAELILCSRNPVKDGFLRNRTLDCFDDIGQRPAGLVCSAFSDLLIRSQDKTTSHILRQPLEILVYTCSQESEHWGVAGKSRADVESSNPDLWGVTMWDFIITYRSWFWRAEALAMSTTNPGPEIIAKPLDFSILQRFSRHRANRVLAGLEKADTVWMAMKIAYLTFRGWPLDKLEEYIANMHTPIGATIPTQAEIDEVLELAVNSGLYIDVREHLETLGEGMDDAISGRRWISCKSMEEASKVESPFKDVDVETKGLLFKTGRPQTNLRDGANEEPKSQPTTDSNSPQANSDPDVQKRVDNSSTHSQSVQPTKDDGSSS